MKKTAHALAVPLPRSTPKKRWYQHVTSSLPTASYHRDGARAVAATSAAFALLFLVSLVILYTRPTRPPPASTLLLPAAVPATELPDAVPRLHPTPNGTARAPPNLTTATPAPALDNHANTSTTARLEQPRRSTPSPSTLANAPLPPAAAPNTTASASASSPATACDASRGEWVYDPDGGPYYTNSTCRTIQEHQNCIKYCRPDTDYLKWRWKPDGCGLLPAFDPAAFLHLMRGKSMAFVGDSLTRNQMQSLMCLLSTELKCFVFLTFSDNICFGCRAKLASCLLSRPCSVWIMLISLSFWNGLMLS